MLQYAEHILVGLAFLLFLGVACLVGVGLLAKLARRPRPAVPAPPPFIYPIPPEERGTGKHVSLLDLVDEHIAAEDVRRRRQRYTEKLYDWARDGTADPKSQ